MNKLIVVGLLGLMLISLLPINSALTNLDVIRNTAITTSQIYNPINYPVAIDTSLIQNNVIKFISFRDVIDDIILVISRWV